MLDNDHFRKQASMAKFWSRLTTQKAYRPIFPKSISERLYSISLLHKGNILCYILIPTNDFLLVVVKNIFSGSIFKAVLVFAITDFFQKVP